MSFDNPAGRLLTALRDAQRQDQQQSAQTGWCKLWELDPAETVDVVECVRRGHQVMALGVEARHAAGDLLPVLVTNNLMRLEQVQAALAYFAVLPSVTMGQMLDPIKPDGWLALENLDGLLSEMAPQPVILEDPLQDLLSQTRSLLDAVLNDETLSPEAKRQIVDQLHEVERALTDSKLAGARPVEIAANGLAGVLTRLYLHGETIAKHKIAKAVLGLVFALDLSLNVAANYEAITSNPFVVQLVENPEDLRPAIDPPAPAELPPPAPTD